MGANVSKVLPDHPLAGGHLEIARAHVVEDGVAEDVFAPVRFRNVAAALADDHRELGFVIRLGGVLRAARSAARPDDRGGKFREYRRHFGNRHLRFRGMIAVIQADADDLRRPRDRRAQPGCRRVEHGSCRGICRSSARRDPGHRRRRGSPKACRPSPASLAVRSPHLPGRQPGSDVFFRSMVIKRNFLRV